MEGRFGERQLESAVDRAAECGAIQPAACGVETLSETRRYCCG